MFEKLKFVLKLSFDFIIIGRFLSKCYQEIERGFEAGYLYDEKLLQ